MALKRLTKDTTCDELASEGRIRLTSQGREIAERTIVRHDLIERMLSEIFGMPWYEIHDEAERLEHARFSPRSFEKKLVEKLGHKDTCPHGNGLAPAQSCRTPPRGVWVCSARPMSRLEAMRSQKSVCERDRKLLEFFGERRTPAREPALAWKPETTTAPCRCR